MNNNLFSHHAYFSVGGREVAEKIKEKINQSGFRVSGNPDFWHNHYEKFGINEAWALRDADTRALFGDKKIYLISYDSITTEAQNALLKTIEEPRANSHFFICVNREEEMLLTLRSRLLKLDTFENVKKDGGKDVVDFLKMGLDERLVFAHKFSEDIKKEKRNKKDAIDFLNDLEKTLYEKQKKGEVRISKRFLEIKKFASINGASIKMIFEEVAIELPVVG